MATQQNVYDQELDFSFGSNIVFDSGLKLKLEDNPSQDFTQDFDNDTGFTYDSDKAEFSGGKVQQKDQRPTNATFGATYTTDINGSWGDGILAGTPIGGAAVSGEKLDLNYNDTRYVIYPVANNFVSDQVGCVKFKLTPNYSGSPGGHQYFWDVSNAGASQNNRVAILQLSSGHLIIRMYDNSGIFIFNAILGVWSPILGTTYELELNWNVTTGATRLFIDGLQYGITDTSTGTHTTVGLIEIRVGTDATASVVSNFAVEDLVLFNTVQHTANYTPGYTLEEYDYLETKVELPTFIYPGVGAIQAFINIVTIETGTPKYIMNDLYYSGGWIGSNGTYAQSNTIAEILAQIATFPASDTIDIDLIFTNANTISDVDILTLTYIGQIYPITEQSFTLTNDLTTEELIAILFSETITGSDTLTWIVEQDGSYLYWSGTEWIASNESLSQRNVSADIIDNIVSLNDGSEMIYNLKGFFVSADGSTTPTLANITIDYSDGLPTIIKIKGIQYSQDTTKSQEKIRVTLNKTGQLYLIKNQILSKSQDITPNQNGEWEINLFDTETMDSPNAHYIWEFSKYNTTVRTGVIRTTVPIVINGEIWFNELPKYVI